MPNACLLIPGARLPESVANDVLSGLSDNEREALLRIQADNGEGVTQVLDTGPYRRAPHRVWLWKVLTREVTYPREAPWEWLSLGAREQAPETWCLSALSLDESGTVTGSVIPDDETFFAATMAISPVLNRAGFRLQLWDNRWFVTCADNLDVVATPLSALYGRNLESTLTGSKADDTRALLDALKEALGGKVAGIDAFWLWGGGRHCRFNPPTLIRSVLCEDAVIRGWANSAGILNTYLLRENALWPDDTAPGDVIAVLSGLYDPWLRGDWKRWAAALPGIADRLEVLRAQAAQREDTTALTVLFGETGSITLTPAKTTLLGRFFGSKKATLGDWVSDHYRRAAAAQ